MIVPRPAGGPHVRAAGMRHTCSPGGAATGGAAVPPCRGRAPGRRRAPGARPSRHRRRCPPRRSTWAVPNAAVATAVAASPRPWRPTSWAVTAGQPGSRPRRCSSTHPRHAERPGSTSGPTTPMPSRNRTGRCATRSRCRAATRVGSGTTASASTHRSGAARAGGGPTLVPGATRRTTSTTASTCGPSPVGVEQTGTQVALLHRTVRPRPRPTRHRCRHVRAPPRRPPRAGRRPPR